jgi:pectate lyase
MIKLTAVSTVNGEATLTFQVDFPDSTIRTVQIPLAEIVEKLKTVKQILGTNITLQDARNVIITIVNQMRQQKSPITERFDFTPYIGVDLEQ